MQPCFVLAVEPVTLTIAICSIVGGLFGLWKSTRE